MADATPAWIEAVFGEEQIVMKCRSEYPNDAGVCSEVIEGDVYELKRMIPLLKFAHVSKQRPVIIDLGAHIGSMSVWAHHLWEKAHIISVEMHPRNVEVLKVNAGDFAEVRHLCVTSQPEIVVADSYVSRVTGGSIVLPADQAEEIDTQEYAVLDPGCELIVFDELVGDYSQVALVKLDIEGSEIELFENSEELNRVQCFVGEFHNYDLFNPCIHAALEQYLISVTPNPLAPHMGTFFAWRV